MLRRGAMLHADASCSVPAPTREAAAGGPISSSTSSTTARGSASRMRSGSGTSRDSCWNRSDPILATSGRSPRGDDWVRRWYRTADRVSAVADALQRRGTSNAGSSSFPTIRRLLFLDGVLHETLASPAIQEPLRQVRADVRRSARREHGLRASSTPPSDLLRRAVKFSPEFAEARLHLGRVLARAGARTRTRCPSCASALSVIEEPDLQYYGHVSSSAVRRRRSATTPARACGVRAAPPPLRPGAQSPLLALSQLAYARGDRDERGGGCSRGSRSCPRSRRRPVVGSTTRTGGAILRPVAPADRRGPAQGDAAVTGDRRRRRARRRAPRRSARASRPAQQPTFSSRLDAVRVDALVTEGGRPVRGLRPDDFVVLDNGMPQTVDLASFETLPLNVILALDQSESVTGDRLAQLQDAAANGAARRSPPRDQAALVTFSHRVAAAAGAHARQRAVGGALARGAAGRRDVAVRRHLRGPARRRERPVAKSRARLQRRRRHRELAVVGADHRRPPSAATRSSTRCRRRTRVGAVPARSGRSDRRLGLRSGVAARALERASWRSSRSSGTATFSATRHKASPAAGLAPARGAGKGPPRRCGEGPRRLHRTVTRRAGFSGARHCTPTIVACAHSVWLSWCCRFSWPRHAAAHSRLRASRRCAPATRRSSEPTTRRRPPHTGGPLPPDHRRPVACEAGVGPC